MAGAKAKAITDEPLETWGAVCARHVDIRDNDPSDGSTTIYVWRDGDITASKFEVPTRLFIKAVLAWRDARDPEKLKTA